MVSATLSGCHRIDTTVLPTMYASRWVSVPVRATGGNGPLTWSATGLPAGLSIDPATGVISGTPAAPGTASVTVRAVDPAADGATQTATYPLEVVAPVEPVAQTPESDRDHGGAVLSDDGRFIAFYTANGATLGLDVALGPLTLVRLDRATHEVRPIVEPSDQNIGLPPAISADGRLVAYVGPATLPQAVTVWDLDEDTTAAVPIDHADAISWNAWATDMSADGRFVAYVVRKLGGVSDDEEHLFVYDRSTGLTERVTGSWASVGTAVISADGSTVAFESDTDGLVEGDGNARTDVFVWDRITGATRRITDNTTGAAGVERPRTYPSISGDGKLVAYALDTSIPGALSLFVWDAATGTTTRVADRVRRPVALSTDGSTLLYQQGGSDPAAPPGIALSDRVTGRRTLLRTQGPDRIGISADGRTVMVDDDWSLRPSRIWTWDLPGGTS